MSIVKKQDSKLDRILASFLDENSIKLTDNEKELKERYEAAFSLLINFRSREQVVSILMSKYNISKATAYRDINRTLIIFGDVTKSQKEAWRYIIAEHNQKLLQMASKEKNFDAMSKCLDRSMKLYQLDKEEAAFNPEKFKSQSYELKISKSAEQILKKVFEKGTINLNHIDAEDIDYKEV